MAIEQTSGDDNSIILKFTNGDLAVIRQLCVDWGFKDEASVILYVLAVMTKATTKTLYVEDEAGGEKRGLTPSASVLKQAEQDAPAAG